LTAQIVTGFRAVFHQGPIERRVSFKSIELNDSPAPSMKLPIIIAGLLLIGAGNLFAQTVIPRDQREGADHAREAEAFFERLHSVPEGFNWRIVNRAVREARIGRMQKMADGVQDGELSVNGTWRELGSDDQCGRIVAVDYGPSSTKRNRSPTLALCITS
jgi:hypothetical protein